MRRIRKKLASEPAEQTSHGILPNRYVVTKQEQPKADEAQKRWGY